MIWSGKANKVGGEWMSSRFPDTTLKNTPVTTLFTMQTPYAAELIATANAVVAPGCVLASDIFRDFPRKTLEHTAFLWPPPTSTLLHGHPHLSRYPTPHLPPPTHSKGILAADESAGTIGKRFESIG